MADEIVIIFGFAIIALQFTCGLFLFVRSRKTRLRPALTLSAFYLLMGTEFVLVTLDIRALYPTWVDTLVLQTWCLCLILFVQQTFVGKDTSTLKAFYIVMAGLWVISFVFSVFQDVPAVSGEGRLGRTIVLASEVAIIGMWQSRLSFIAYKRYRARSGVYSPIAVTRYFLIYLSSFLLIPFYVVDVIGTYFSIYAVVDYSIILFVDMIILFAYELMSFIAWVTPGWIFPLLRPFIKGIWNKIETLPASPALDTSSDKTSIENALLSTDRKPLTTRKDIFNAIEFTGNVLAPLLRVSPSAAKGFLLVLIEEHTKDSGSFVMSVDELLEIINTPFRKRLHDLRIHDADNITDTFRNELIRNESVFLMIGI